MKLSRREFLLFVATVAGGCQTLPEGGVPGAKGPLVVNAGRAGDFKADGVYSNFRDEGFFVVRRGGELFALSAICTHRKCTLAAEPDRSFYCKCHGSTFDPAGHVTKGPAKHDLPLLPAHTDDQGLLIVEVPAR